MTIHARFRVDQGDFVLDVDLNIPSRGVTSVFGPRVVSRFHRKNGVFPAQAQPAA